MLLGHLGADIIKVEPPNGDEFRRIWMQPGATTDAYESLWINVNKKSIVLNLRTKKEWSWRASSLRAPMCSSRTTKKG